MGETIKYHVYFIDAGNCDIFDVPVEAYNFVNAMENAHDAYSRTEHPFQDIATVRIDLA